MRNTGAGMLTFMAGKLRTNYIPLIIPQSCAKLPDRIICRAALPATVAIVAACDALANALTDFVAAPTMIYLGQAFLIGLLSKLLSNTWKFMLIRIESFGETARGSSNSNCTSMNLSETLIFCLT